MSVQKKDTQSITVTTLKKMKAEGEKIACLTAYDASFATVLDEAGIDIILVGDSLGMVVQGHETTVRVTVDDMLYHSRAVARGCERAMLMVDMPFMSYSSSAQALETARRLMQEGGAHMVKLEGGMREVETVQKLAEQGVPVCGHIGLQPQLIHKLGGYRVQGRDNHQATKMIEDAVELEKAGADVLLLECVPAFLAAEITANLSIPTIGIGASPDCDGQILVLHDILGITAGHVPKFAKNFIQGKESIQDAIGSYVADVKAGKFPAAEHCFTR